MRYEFNRNAQTYFTYSRGYKAFALDLGAATNANNPGLDPEHVNAYELGFKIRTADGKFDLNAAAFRSEYSDLQLQTTIVDPVTGTGTAKQVNAGNSISQGIELMWDAARGGDAGMSITVVTQPGGPEVAYDDLTLGHGRWATINVDGAVGGALAPGLTARVAGSYVRTLSGWQTDRDTGREFGKPDRLKLRRADAARPA